MKHNFIFNVPGKSIFCAWLKTADCPPLDLIPWLSLGVFSLIVGTPTFTFGLSGSSCETPAAPPDPAAAPPHFKHHRNSTRKAPKESEKSDILRREKEKTKARKCGLHPFWPRNFGAAPVGAPPFCVCPHVFWFGHPAFGPPPFVPPPSGLHTTGPCFYFSFFVFLFRMAFGC